MSLKNRDYSHSRVKDTASRDTLGSLWVTGADEKDLDPHLRTQPWEKGPKGSYSQHRPEVLSASLVMANWPKLASSDYGMPGPWLGKAVWYSRSKLGQKELSSPNLAVTTYWRFSCSGDCPCAHQGVGVTTWPWRLQAPHEERGTAHTLQGGSSPCHLIHTAQSLDYTLFFTLNDPYLCLTSIFITLATLKSNFNWHMKAYVFTINETSWWFDTCMHTCFCLNHVQHLYPPKYYSLILEETFQILSSGLLKYMVHF